MDIEFRSYKTGDSFGIAQLLSKLPYKRDTAYWTWMYRLLNAIDPVISLAVVKENAGERVVGYTAAAVKTVLFNGESFLCAQGMHAFVDPEFRKYEYIIYEINSNMHRYCIARGIKCIFGFPNAAARAYIQHMHEVAPIGFFKAMEYSYNTAFTKSTDVLLEENKLDVFDALHRITILKEENKGAPVHFNYSSQYYYFRYFANPENTYQVKWIIKNYAVAGVVFLKTYTNGNTTFGHLVEYIIHKQLVSYEEMVQLVITDFEGKVNKLAFWPVEEEFKNCLTKLSFEAAGFDTMFTVRFLDEDFKEKCAQVLLDFNSWSLQMGDSDAF